MNKLDQWIKPVGAGRFRSRSTESTAGAMLPGIGRRLRWVGAMVP